MADPVIEKLSGDTLAYLEGAGSKFIDQGDSASVSDTDTTDFADGSLTVTISSGGDFSEDFLSVNDKGSLTVVSDELKFSGDTFATFTGGGDGDALVIDFNDSGFAGIDAVSALLRAITYQNSDDENPTLGDRTVHFVLDDGDSGSASVDATVSITPTPDDPVIADLEDDVLKYTEDDAATVIDQGTPASVTDVDSANFDTGLLSVAITVGGVADQDVLGIRNQGTGVGEIGVSGSDVTFGGVVIGTVSGGSGGTPLDIQLNATATPAATSGLLANITYQNTNTDAPSVARRTVSFDLNDGAGGIADLEATVDVIAKNDAPLVHLPPTSPTVTEDSEDISISPAIGVEDVDGDTLTVTMTASSTMTMTTITNLVFSEGNGLDDQLMSFTGAVADINDALATLSYTPTPDQDTGGQIAITVSDGKDETTDTLTINITPSQDEPVTTSHGGASEVFLDIAENTTAVTQVTAEDADTGDVLTFSIKDSDDGAFFDVDPVTGVVSFKSAPDFETPADGDGDNQYIVVVEVSDGTDTDAVEFGVTVTDIAALNLVGTKNKDTLIGGDEGDVIKGKNGKDTLKGLGGDDELNGGKGKDKMIGGDGKDGFVFADKLKSSNVDKVKDFAVNVDRIHLNDKIFTKIGNEGGLKGKYFEKGKKADDGKDRIIYDKKTGNLFYDKDGKGGKDQVKFAQLDKKLKLDADDFLVV